MIESKIEPWKKRTTISPPSTPRKAKKQKVEFCFYFAVFSLILIAFFFLFHFLESICHPTNVRKFFAILANLKKKNRRQKYIRMQTEMLKDCTLMFAAKIQSVP